MSAGRDEVGIAFGGGSVSGALGRIKPALSRLISFCELSGLLW
jgi:hypothetical protein